MFVNCSSRNQGSSTGVSSNYVAVGSCWNLHLECCYTDCHSQLPLSSFLPHSWKPDILFTAEEEKIAGWYWRLDDGVEKTPCVAPLTRPVAVICIVSHELAISCILLHSNFNKFRLRIGFVHIFGRPVDVSPWEAFVWRGEKFGFSKTSSYLFFELGNAVNLQRPSATYRGFRLVLQESKYRRSGRRDATKICSLLPWNLNHRF